MTTSRLSGGKAATTKPALPDSPTPAVGLAAGMFALADGSDMGCSLRNPASLCNVVGLRP